MFKILFIVGMMILTPIWLTIVAILSNGNTTCIYDVMGIKCLGCNGLGAMNALVKGDIIRSIHLNPLIIVWLIIGCGLLILEIWGQIKRYKSDRQRVDTIGDQIIRWMFQGINFREE